MEGIESRDNKVPLRFIPKSITAFQGHSKAISSIAVNRTGSRMATGGNDSEIHLWDFGQMTSSPKHYKQILPVCGHGIQAVDFSPSGSQIVCATGDAIARVYNIDGNKIQETVRGDMYVRDLSQTRGHTHSVNYCQWNPQENNIFMTASSDATIRIFDLNAKPYGVDQALPHLHVLKAVDKRNLNIANHCRVLIGKWEPGDAKFIIGGCSDSSLQLWDKRSTYSKPDKVIRDAHETGCEISGLQIFKDSYRLLSRGTDGTMKLWDIRNLKIPINTWDNLNNDIYNVGLSVNPEETIIVAGTSSSTNESYIMFFDAITFEVIDSKKIEALNSSLKNRGFSVSSIVWSEVLEQLIIGSTDGFLHIMYDNDFSKKGAISFLNRPSVNKKHVLEGHQIPVFNSDCLPEGYKETRWGKIRKVKVKPIPSLVNSDTRFYSVSNSYQGKAINLSDENYKDKENQNITDYDPVEAIRAYAEKAEKEPVFVSQAYRKTQPMPLLDYVMEDADEEKLVSNVNKCPRCGLKLCQCGYMKFGKNNKVLLMQNIIIGVCLFKRPISKTRNSDFII